MTTDGNHGAARRQFVNTALAEALRTSQDVYPVQLWCGFMASGEFSMMPPPNPAQLSLMIHLLADAMIQNLKKPAALISPGSAEGADRFHV